MRNNGIANPARRWVDYAPIKEQHLADHHAPDRQNTMEHLERVESASRGWGFPVAPCARQWPPKAAARGQRMVWP